MADQAITALPKKTYSGSSQIASTDYLLGIDSAEGYQMLIQDLGEYIINRATASLAGSTQTLASAISALNSKWQRDGSGSPVDADTLNNGYWYGVLSAQTSPTGSQNWFNVYTNNYNPGIQIANLYNGAETYIRGRSQNQWMSWVKQPTRAELTNQVLTITLNATNTTRGNMYGVRNGQIVTIGGWFTPKTDIALKDVIASGLPTCQNSVNVFLFDQNDCTAGAAYIDRNSSNMTWEYNFSSMVGHVINIAATYITQDPV